MWNKLISASFNKWAKTYDADISRSFQRRGITYEHIWKLIDRELSIHEGAVLLEIGVGTGMLGQYSKKHQVVGIDISQSMLQEASKKGGYKELIHCSANKLPFPNEYFDGVYTAFMFHSERNPKRLLNECSRVLKVGARLVVVDLFPRHQKMKLFHWLWSNYHSMRYEKFAPSLYRPLRVQAALFENSFSDICSYYIDIHADAAEKSSGYMSHGLISGTKCHD